MNLFYNGQTFNASASARRFARPAAINWRYQVESEEIATLPVETVRKPQQSGVTNWRYQLPA